LRNPQAGLDYGLDGAGGDGVVIAENTIWARLDFQQFPHGVVSRILAVLSAGDVSGVRRETVTGECTPVSAEAAGAGSDRRAAKVGYAAASLRDEVFGGHGSEFFVPYSHVVSVGAGQHAVNQNIGHFIAVELLKKIEPAPSLSGRDN
jgi:hypothetical protein